MSADELTMLRAALSQLDGKLDYKVFAKDIGAPNPSAAWKRWDYYKKKLFRSAGIGPQPVTPQRTPNSKKSGSPSKKRKSVETDEEADDEEEIGCSRGEDNEKAGVRFKATETPTKRLPARAARATVFKAEDDEYFEDFEKFKGSGHVGSDMEDEEKDSEEFSDVEEV